VLERAVQKACRSLDVFLEKKPMATHTRLAFDSLLERITLDLGKKNDHDFTNNSVQDLIPKAFPGGIILDSGCGTGRSTQYLAQANSDHLVIGIDRSIARLTKTKANQRQPEHSDDTISDVYTHSIAPNAYIVRAELVDFWTCCMEHDQEFWTQHIERHYLLYPNPYPTLQRLSSRWYAHPSFPLILKLNANQIILRSNWENYLKEFAQAVMIANDCYVNEHGYDHGNPATPYVESAKQGPSERTDKSVAWTNFEAKYDAVGEPSFELVLEQG
jgi:tRNA G46 methylase TrmB